MRKLLITLLFLAYSSGLISQDTTLINQSLQLAGSAFVFGESNPTEVPETDSINRILQASLTQHRIKHSGSSKEISDIFRELYKNGGSAYSDSPDERRMKLRRAACFASIALLSCPDKGLTFIEYAKLTLSEDINNPKIEFLEGPFLGLLIIELVLKYEDGQINPENLKEVNDFVNLHQNNISPKIRDQPTRLINTFMEIIN